MQRSGLDGRLPIFAFPNSLTFYTGDPSTHKQILTLYNPYDFPIAYSVLCNNGSCFTVESPEGVLREKWNVDIVITRTNLSLNDATDRERFRIVITEAGRRQILGKRDVPVTLVSGVPDPRTAGDSDNFESARSPSRLGEGGGIAGSNLGPHQRQHPFVQHGNTGPSLVLVGAAVVCLLGLLVPTEGDKTPTIFPTYLHLNANIKIVIAYVLGLLTYAILRAG